MNYTLYPYQQQMTTDALSYLDGGGRSLIVQLATRGGKSGIIAALTEEFKARQQYTYFMCHTNILLDQMSAEFDFHEIRHGVVAAGFPQQKYYTQVISKDTLSRRHEKLRALGWPDPDYIIIDEAHRIMGQTYLNLLDVYPKAKVIGFTATPKRLDNRPMGDVFDHIICGPQISELQDMGKLCQIEPFIPTEMDMSNIGMVGGDYKTDDVIRQIEKQKIVGNAVQHYQRHASGRKALTFCSSIAHCEIVAEEFSTAGIPSVAISSSDGREGVKTKLADYYAGNYVNLVSCNLFIEGLTVRDCGCIIDLAPTKSLTRFMQKVGRGMMVADGKPELIHLDCVGNVRNHGLPQWDRIWTLDSSSGELAEPTMIKQCPECYHAVPKTAKVCPWCGHEFKREVLTSRIPEQIEGELISIKDLPWLEKKQKRQELVVAIARSGVTTLKEAVAIARSMGYVHTEAYHVWVDHLKHTA